MKYNVKKILCLVMALLMAASMAACGGNEKHTLQFSWAESNTNVISPGFELMAERARELTDGAVDIQIYYNASLMSNDAEFNAIMSGDLDMTRRSCGELEGMCPGISIMSVPYIFVSWEHCIDTITGPTGDKIVEMLNNELDCVVLGLYCLGARIVNTTLEEPVMTPDDLAGVVMRVPEGAGWLHMGNALGATATPLALTETYTALQTGVVQVQDNPLPGTYSNRFFEVANQISLTNHSYSVSMICISKNAWNSLSEEQQAALQQAADEGIAKCHEDVEKETEQMLAFYKENGNMIVEPDIAAFQEYAMNYYKSNGLDANWPKDIYEEISASAANYM